MSYSNNNVRFGSHDCERREFWKDAYMWYPAGALLESPFMGQAGYFLNHVSGFDGFQPVTGYDWGVTNALIGIDDDGRLWVYRVVKGSESTELVYQTSRVVNVRQCVWRTDSEVDRLGILIQTMSGASHWVMPGPVRWDLPAER